MVVQRIGGPSLSFSPSTTADDEELSLTSTHKVLVKTLNIKQKTKKNKSVHFLEFVTIYINNRWCLEDCSAEECWYTKAEMHAMKRAKYEAVWKLNRQDLALAQEQVHGQCSLWAQEQQDAQQVQLPESIKLNLDASDCYLYAGLHSQAIHNHVYWRRRELWGTVLKLHDDKRLAQYCQATTRTCQIWAQVVAIASWNAGNSAVTTIK